jgi:phosphomannomutase
MESLRARLVYEPRELKFGTSGRRGAVVNLTQLEIYINVTGEIEYLGGRPGDTFYFAHDLRPSSTRLVAEEDGRGEICQAVEAALLDKGMRPVNLGEIPTPALMHYAVSRGCASIMVTGSHIPFRLNGYKLNTASGELMKSEEAAVTEAVARVRERVYCGSFDESRFDERGMLKQGHRELSPADGAARELYRERFRAFFPAGALDGMRVLVYQHSAVGRDLVVDILRDLGAEVVPAGRSEVFVPIDTENVDASLLAAIQELAAGAGKLDAVVSVDGDSDRPLVLGVDPATSVLRFFGGDLVGMIAAEYLRADSVAVPITCNDGIDRGPLAAVLEAKTRVGSPYVIEAMEAARARGKRAVCGWEANGGFLTGTGIERDGRRLSTLATRDAVLPILCVLASAREKNLPVTALFAQLPQRYSRAALLKNFPRTVGREIITRFSLGAARGLLEQLLDLGPIATLDLTDGLRVRLDNGDVVHLRPSGNADEFRIYAVADTQERADAIAEAGVAEPDGILRRIERAVN